MPECSSLRVKGDTSSQLSVENKNGEHVGRLSQALVWGKIGSARGGLRHVVGGFTRHLDSGRAQPSWPNLRGNDLQAKRHKKIATIRLSDENRYGPISAV